MDEAHIIGLIGRTPIIQLRHLGSNDANIYVKLESYNPGGSVKDRIALQMILDAETEGKIKPGDTLIEATSGNTGIGMALVAAAKGYKAILVMPDTMSIERINLLKAYGAKVILTPGKTGMKGAIEKANELVSQYGYFLLRQFENPSNPKAHRLTTAPEILSQISEKIDAFVAGIGTGGTITGIGEVLKEKFPQLLVMGVEPKDSPVLSGGQSGPHQLQGIGAGFIPYILNTKIIDEIFQVSTEEAYGAARELAEKEGIFGGITTGAAVFAAKTLAKRLGKGKNIVVIAPDGGEKYLSTDLYRFD